MIEKICNLNEVQESIAISKEINGKKIAIVKSGNEIFAFDDECTHKRFPLSEGFVEGNVIECSHHGARFDMRDGKVLALPAEAPLKVYKTTVKGEEVLIEI